MWLTSVRSIADPFLTDQVQHSRKIRGDLSRGVSVALLGQRNGRRKEGQALRGSFVAEDVFHGFSTVAPLKIHFGPLQPRPEWAGMVEPGGAGPRPEWSDHPQLYRARRVDTKPLTTDTLLPVRGTRQGIGLSHRGDLGLTPPVHDLPPRRGSKQAPRNHDPKTTHQTKPATAMARHRADQVQRFIRPSRGSPGRGSRRAKRYLGACLQN